MRGVFAVGNDSGTVRGLFAAVFYDLAQLFDEMVDSRVRFHFSEKFSGLRPALVFKVNHSSAFLSTLGQVMRTALVCCERIRRVGSHSQFEEAVLMAAT